MASVHSQRVGGMPSPDFGVVLRATKEEAGRPPTPKADDKAYDAALEELPGKPYDTFMILGAACTERVLGAARQRLSFP